MWNDANRCRFAVQSKLLICSEEIMKFLSDSEIAIGISGHGDTVYDKFLNYTFS